jgi:hypothetical protein
MAKRTAPVKPDAAPGEGAPSTLDEEIKDRVQSENVEPEKVENPPEGLMTGVVKDAEKIQQVVSTKRETIEVDRKLFNKMITTLVLNKGLFLYTGMGLTTQLGEMFGLKKDEPGFYEKARALVHEIMVEHQKG